MAALTKAFEEYATAVPVPGPSEWVVHDPCGHRTITFRRPPANVDEEGVLLAEWAITLRVLRTIGVDGLCTLFAAMLRERSTVVVCSELSMLTRVVLALLAFVKPLQWEGTLLHCSACSLIIASRCVAPSDAPTPKHDDGGAGTTTPPTAELTVFTAVVGTIYFRRAAATCRGQY